MPHEYILLVDEVNYRNGDKIFAFSNILKKHYFDTFAEHYRALEKKKNILPKIILPI